MSLLLQIDANPTATAEAAEESLSVLDLALKGGPIMIPILIFSIIAVYIIIERWISIKKSSKIDNNFMNNIRDHIHNGNIDAGKALCRNTSNPIARMIEKGIARIGRPLNDIEKSIENVGNVEIVKLEKGLSALATIAAAAPMVGFLGTVIGMLKAFFQMSKAGEQIEISMLSGGMYEAMVTTVAGLFVGIIALIGYNILAAMVQKVIYDMEASSIEFMDLLQEPSK